MEAGTVPGTDFRMLTPEAQSAAEAIWSILPEWTAWTHRGRSLPVVLSSR